MNHKNFKSVDGEEHRLAFTNGHVYLVGDEWISLPEFAWAEAYGNKCISEEFFKKTRIDPSIDHVERFPAPMTKEEVEQKIKQVFKDLVDENNPDNFDNKNYPKMGVLNERVGRTIPPPQRNKLWEQFLTENE
jgi:hypothetical protein